MVNDRGRIAGGMTSRTSAHLAPLCDDLVSEMTKNQGKESNEGKSNRLKIDCDFRRLDGYLFQGRDMPAKTIDQEMDAARDIGVPVHRLVGLPLNGCADRQCAALPAPGDLPSSTP
jgi:hypothetical protein